MKLKTYIKEVRNITITEAAQELKCSRQWLTMVCNGEPAGRSLSRRIYTWSDGNVSMAETMIPQAEI